MTDAEIQASRDYLYGYYCGRIGCYFRHPTEAWQMGWEDANSDPPRSSDHEPVVSTDASWWSNQDIEGLLIGTFTPRMGLHLYFGIEDKDDPVANTVWRWSTTKYPESQTPHGWIIMRYR